MAGRRAARQPCRRFGAGLCTRIGLCTGKGTHCMMSDQPINHLDSNMMLADDALLTKAADWHSAGHRLALAFVIHTWGSSPRQVGSLMLVREDSQIAGSVSGGCVEGTVIDAALEIIKTGGSQRFDFGGASTRPCAGHIPSARMPSSA